MNRWSSLQRELYKIIDEKISFQIHIAVDRMDIFNSLTRYWITVGDETVFDYPKNFVQKTENGKICAFAAEGKFTDDPIEEAFFGSGKVVQKNNINQIRFIF